MATWSAILLGFAIPISTAASNTLLAMVVVLFVVSGDYRYKFRTIADNPVSLAILLFCAVTALGCAYGLGSATDKLHYLGKYLTLLLVPLLLPLFANRVDRLRALVAFGAAMLLTLALSYSIRFDWLPAGIRALVDSRDPVMWGAGNPVVFKLHITHGFLMAIAAFLLMIAARQVSRPRLRWTCMAFSFLAACNVLLMVKGRTGFVVLAVLGTYLVFRRFGRKGIIIAALGFALMVSAAYQWSSSFHARMQETISEAGAWREGKGDQTATGLRLDYYSNTLAIIRDQPWLGVGTGGFERAYGERIQNTQMLPSNNPHNQYLLIAAQLGLVGLAALIFLYLTYWRQAGGLTPSFQQIAHGVLLAMLVGNLFNSFMLDFTERIFFAWISGVLFAESTARRAAQSE
ncbi:MAG: O-antigen ligase family protein [Proteobacteria bacterium]|nr:O-antigen ligase family protein [Pseudomonadota bacterium]